MNHVKKIGLIVKTSFVIPVMTVFATFWTLMMIRLVAKANFFELFTLKNCLAIVLTINLLWVLRLIDEIKDFEYDKIAHPERALPSGLVSQKDIILYIMIFSLLGIVGSAFFHSLLILFYPLTILYGLFLIKLENMSDTIKSNFLVNLAITYPVNTLINISLASYYCSTLTQLSRALIYVFIPFFAFLHYEFSRKTMRVSKDTQGLELYSEQIGFMNSLIFSIGTGFLAALITSCLVGFSIIHVLFMTWPILFGALYFYNLIKPKFYKGSAMIFIFGLYFSIILT